MEREEHDPAGALADARRTIARQASEIERLRAEADDHRLAAALRESLLAAASTGAIGAPGQHHATLTAIVETAAEVLAARASSLFLIDEAREELVFQVALGPEAEAVKQFRVPLGQGIAGYVAATGQPLAIADAQRDPRLARDIGEAIGYTPTSLLCVPLFLGERVIGVLEMLDKENGRPFTAHDMEVLGRFSQLAALTIEQSRLTHDLGHLFRSLLLDAADDTLARPAADFAGRFAADETTAAAMELAQLARQIAQRGDASRQLLIDLLTGLDRYTAATTAAYHPR